MGQALKQQSELPCELVQLIVHLQQTAQDQAGAIDTAIRFIQVADEFVFTRKVTKTLIKVVHAVFLLVDDEQKMFDVAVELLEFNFIRIGFGERCRFVLDVASEQHVVELFS